MGSVTRYDMFIDGEWVPAGSRERMPVVFPYSRQVWANVPSGGIADVDKAVQAGRQAFTVGEWRVVSPQHRSSLLRNLAALIRDRAEELAELETRSNGKLIGESLSQMKAVPRWFDFYAGLAELMFGETIPLGKPNTLDYTVREPCGVIGAIVPWNSPLLLMSYKVAPALAAGNTVVIKPAEETPVTALEFAKLSEEAGFPPGVINVVTGSGEGVGSALVNHPGVDKIMFTGGTQTGKIIARDAGARLASVSLELGGKSPNIVFADANLDKALTGVVRGIFSAGGQTCRAGSRLLVENAIAEDFISKLVEIAGSIRLGDPFEAETQMGPIASGDQLAHIEAMVTSAVQEGAEILTGGKRLIRRDGKETAFFLPTILDNVHPEMKVAQEEVFGPVLCVFRFSDEEEALQIANATRYALGAGVWTQSINRALRMVEKIDSGSIWVNTYREGSHLVPFGGNRESGFGRENGLEVLREVTKVKNVWIDYSEDSGDPFVMRF